MKRNINIFDNHISFSKIMIAGEGVKMRFFLKNSIYSELSPENNPIEKYFSVLLFPPPAINDECGAKISDLLENPNCKMNKMSMKYSMLFTQSTGY